MYWLSIISSVTGIISFVISFFDYFKKWRTYLLYFACLMGGLTIGVILSMSEQTVQQFTQSQLIYLIALVSLVGLLVLFIYRFLTNAHEPLFVAIIFLVLAGWFTLRILNTVESSQSFIKPNEYLIISNHYDSTGDYTKAADFLKKYRELQTQHLPDAMLDSIDKKVNTLYYKGLGIKK